MSLDNLEIENNETTLENNTSLENNTIAEKEDNLTDNSLPDKFKDENGELDVQKILKSYSELEKKLSSNNKNINNKDIDDVKEEKDSLLDNLEKDISIDDLIDEIENNFLKSDTNEVSEEDIKKLKEKGMSDKIIKKITDSWIENKNKSVENEKNFENEVYEKFGGQDKYKEIFKWFKEEDPESFELYKESLKNGNKNEILQNVNSVLRRFKISGSSINGSVSKTNEIFNSIFDYYKEINSQKYKNDLEYQKEVTEKAKRSGFYK